ncbi:MAG: response regulator transcription factor, partial [Eubacterium callanderi]
VLPYRQRKGEGRMNEKKTPVILMVEDNEHVRALNCSVLERAGYRVLTAKSLAETRRILAGKPGISLVVLDILLPDGNGLAFISELRQSTQAPVLLLSSRRDYEDIVNGLTGGADDYMTKPYRIEELLARIVGLLRRREAMCPPAEVARGPLVMDTVAQRGFLFDRDMLLQPREYAILLFLIQNEGRGISAEQLYEAVWKLPAAGNAGAVRTAVSRLRRKLAGSGYTITSGRGSGYCFEKES